MSAAAHYFGINKIAQDETIFEEGDIGNFMCIVHSGSIAVIKANQNEQQVEMATLGQGRAFGEMAVLDGELRSATCQATEDTILLTLSKEALDQMLEEHPRIGSRRHPRHRRQPVAPVAHGGGTTGRSHRLTETMLDFTEYTKIFISLFAIIDPVGIIPIIIAFTAGMTAQKRERVGRMASLSVFVHPARSPVAGRGDTGISSASASIPSARRAASCCC